MNEKKNNNDRGGGIALYYIRLMLEGNSTLWLISSPLGLILSLPTVIHSFFSHKRSIIFRIRRKYLKNIL